VFIGISFPFDEIEIFVVFKLGVQDTFRDEAFITLGVDFDPRRRVLWLVMMTLLVFLK
jgi:hypothetical protein